MKYIGEKLRTDNSGTLGPVVMLESHDMLDPDMSKFAAVAATRMNSRCDLQHSPRNLMMIEHCRAALRKLDSIALNLWSLQSVMWYWFAPGIVKMDRNIKPVRKAFMWTSNARSISGRWDWDSHPMTWQTGGDRPHINTSNSFAVPVEFEMRLILGVRYPSNLFIVIPPHTNLP